MTKELENNLGSIGHPIIDRSSIGIPGGEKYLKKIKHERYILIGPDYYVRKAKWYNLKLFSFSAIFALTGLLLYKLPDWKNPEMHKIYLQYIHNPKENLVGDSVRFDKYFKSKEKGLKCLSTGGLLTVISLLAGAGGRLSYLEKASEMRPKGGLW